MADEDLKAGMASGLEVPFEENFRIHTIGIHRQADMYVYIHIYIIYIYIHIQ